MTGYIPGFTQVLEDKRIMESSSIHNNKELCLEIRYTHALLLLSLTLTHTHTQHTAQYTHESESLSINSFTTKVKTPAHYLLSKLLLFRFSEISEKAVA